MSTNATTSEIWFINTLKCLCDVLYAFFFTIGNIHLQFHSSGNHYVWSKVTSTVHNIIVGKLWIDQVCSSWTAVRKAFWRSFTFFLYVLDSLSFICGLVFVAYHVQRNIFYACLFIPLKWVYELLQDKKTTWMKGFKLHLYVLHFFLLNLFSQIY